MLRCANCGYETEETNDLGYCQTCAKAYSYGYENGKAENLERK